MRNMFQNFKFTTLRPRTKSLPNADQENGNKNTSCKSNKTKTPLGSPITRRENRKRNSELDSSPSISSLRSESVALLGDQHQRSSYEDRIYNSTPKSASEQPSPSIGGCNAFMIEEGEDHSYTTDSCPYVSSKVAVINVERIDGSLGITLRGGYMPEHPHLSRPLTITQVRTNGAAYRTGLIRVGDRVLQVDGHPLSQRTLTDAQCILQYCNSNISRLSIEYDVSGVLEAAVQYASSGPLLVEIERLGNEELGLLLSQQDDNDNIDGVMVEGVVAASTADRCGALHAGDLLMAVDEVPVQHLMGGVQELTTCLCTATKLQILPREAVAQLNLQRHLQRYQNSMYSTVNSRRSKAAQRNRHSAKYLDSVDAGVSQCTVAGQQGNTSTSVCHPETLSVTLTAERGTGYGLAVTVQQSDIVISRLTVDGAAFRCGSLQVGDRVLVVNRQPNLTLQEIQAILDMGLESPDALSSGRREVQVTVEFNVGDTVVPSTGIFTVRLPKPRSSLGQGLGITITTGGGDIGDINAPFLITEIRRGSAAHRAGCLHAGDHLLAIDGRPLDRLSVDGVLRLLQCDNSASLQDSNGVVSLRVEKTELDRSNLRLDRVVYSVELQRRTGDDLGITIGYCVEDNSLGNGVVLTRLQSGGLAYQTGALHVNDRLLAINGQSLEHKSLSDVMRLLQMAGDRVHIKISRNIQQMATDSSVPSSAEDMTIQDGGSNGPFDSLGLLSNSDSAVHSWNSNSNNDKLNFDMGVISDDCHQSTAPSTLSSSTCPSPLPLPLPTSAYNYMDNCTDLMDTTSGTAPMRIAVSLHKDTIYDDYGFSVSDGLYARGVFVNRIRQGGPADLARLLAPFDRIVQVNDTCTVDFDCCLTVPLIASAGDRIDLVVERDPPNICVTNLSMVERDTLHLNLMPNRTPFSSSQSTITKTL